MRRVYKEYPIHFYLCRARKLENCYSYFVRIDLFILQDLTIILGTEIVLLLLLLCY